VEGSLTTCRAVPTPTTPPQREMARAPSDHHRHLRARVRANGYHGTGVAELCEANELGKGALYHYIGRRKSCSPPSTTA
jgi:hypothetical protein